MIDYTINSSELEYFLLILVRISVFSYMAPFIGTRGVPARTKIGFSFFMSVLIYNLSPTHPEMIYSTVWGYAAIVIKEALTGAVIGLGAVISTTIVTFAGRIIDMETGLSMANLMDPTTNEMESISGVLYQYMVTLLLLITGMYQYVLKALAETFVLIPINGAVFSSDKLLTAITKFLNDYMSIGFRICLPVFAVMLLLNAILGIMTKVAPQINMFSVGMQIKVLTGLFVLFITAGMMPIISNWIYEEIKITMVGFVSALM